MDLIIRARILEDSSLIVRHLFENSLLLVASPEYLALHGESKEPIELKRHNCLVYTMLKTLNNWHFTRDDEQFSVPVSGNFQSDNGDVILEVALAGLGFAQLPIWMVGEHLKSGRLQQVLPDYKTQTLPFNAIYPQNRYVPLKVRCFVDFMKLKLSENTMYK
ncbi:substrate binding domain-containing protein [uncultured Shewanella sp.]|uniref:substrate binding domain-containing protein n=1 Tax=uncultured Shewanella sp. TaxID=173975 RepID=UPI002623DECC|nr:substrate binding domain-containing protein [uncultured Shewanella sp.]